MNKRIITASAAAIVLAFAGTLRADFNPLKLGWEDFSLYTDGDNVTNMEDTASAANYTTTISGESYKLTGSWSSGEDFSDEVSTIDGGEFKLNTDGAVVTNTLLDAATLNGVLAGDITEYDEDAVNGEVFIKTTATFVPTDTLEDFSAEGDSSDLKFAIYAYADEDATPATTNLVIYHKYWDANSDQHYVTDVFSNLVMNIDFSQPVGLEITVCDPFGDAVDFRFFKVKVEQGAESEVLTSDFGASDANVAPDADYAAIADGGPWFMTANGGEAGLKDITSLSFKGTGTISDIQVGIYTDGEPPTPPVTYTVDWTGSENVVVSNGTAEVSGTSGSFAADTVLVFYPTVGSITNVDGVAVADLPSYSYTVTTDASQSLVVLAGEEETPPAPTTYAVEWTGSENVVVSNGAVEVSETYGKFEAGTELTFTATVGSITNVTGYVTDTPTNSFVYVVLAVDNQELVVLAGEEVVPPAPTMPEWFDDNPDADVAAAYDTWAAGQSVSDLATTDYSAQFLMNVEATVNAIALTIDAIEITEEGTQITVGATGDNVAINLETINGVLNVDVAQTLGTWAHKSIPAANLDFVNSKAVVIIPATEGKFVKASVDYAAGDEAIEEVVQP